MQNNQLNRGIVAGLIIGVNKRGRKAYPNIIRPKKQAKIDRKYVPKKSNKRKLLYLYELLIYRIL